MKKGFNYCKKWLRKNFPTKRPCAIYLVTRRAIVRHMEEDDDKSPNEAYNYDGYFRLTESTDGELVRYGHKKINIIYISNSLSERDKISTLLHEYAHILQSQEINGFEQLHGNIFQKHHKKLQNAWKCITN